MQIVEKSGEGLSRVYGVTIPAALRRQLAALERCFGVAMEDCIAHLVDRASGGRAEDNARNALQSAGPRTTSGKVASRLNAPFLFLGVAAGSASPARPANCPPSRWSAG